MRAPALIMWPVRSGDHLRVPSPGSGMSADAVELTVAEHVGRHMQGIGPSAPGTEAGLVGAVGMVLDAQPGASRLAGRFRACPPSTRRVARPPLTGALALTTGGSPTSCCRPSPHRPSGADRPAVGAREVLLTGQPAGWRIRRLVFLGCE